MASDRLRIEPWWSNGDTTRLVLSEYFKYLFAKVRMRFDSVAFEAGNNRISEVRLSSYPSILRGAPSSRNAG